MEHLLLMAVTIGLKDLTICSAWLGDNIFSEANQSSTSIDTRGHCDWDFFFGSWKSGRKMSFYFGRNMGKKIAMNPSIYIGRPHSHVTRTRLSSCDIFNPVIRVLPLHITMKNYNENLVENLRDNKI